MSNYLTGSVIFVFLALLASSCSKTPADNISTDGILPAPLRISNDLSQCPDIAGTYPSSALRISTEAF